MFIAFAFPLQLAASLLAFAARDGALGTALGVLSGTWLVTGLSWLTTPPQSVSGTLGLLLLASGGLLAAVALTSGRLLPGAIFFTEAVRFALIGIHELGAPKVWQHAGGVLGLVVVALAGSAVVTKAREDARVDQLEAEPGVRPQL